MKIVKIASAAIMALLATSLVSCTKQEEKEQAPVQEVTFSVELNLAEAEYAEVVVRHDGADSDKWFGFVTTDLTSDVQDLIAAQVSQLDKKKLHVGKAQTVAVRSLAEHVNYRYVAFGVNEDGTAYGKPGSIAFCSTPKFNVKFAAEASSVEAHKATFAVSHNGIEALTYLAFITDDTKSEAATLAAADFAKNVKDGKLVEGVTPLSGTAKSISFEELTHETSYRLIVYGLFDNNGTVVYYGTPADVAFTTPVDLALVSFSVTASEIKKNAANINVSYNAKSEDLTWYGFYTLDLTADIATLIAAETAGVTSDNYYKGPQTVAFEDLEPETTYRVVITGINADGVYGTPAEVQFTTLTAAYDNTVFTVTASDITPYSVKFNVTHTGYDEFEYAGFFTEDFESAVADVALPSNIDASLMTGKDNTFTVENLTAITKYRYIVVGRVQGNEYGTRGEVVFTTADNVVSMPYEDYIGRWKVEGTVFTISAEETGVSFAIEGLPGSNAVNNGNAIVIGQYDSEKGNLYVMEQDLGQYNNSSYGPVGEYYSGASLATLTGGAQSQWPYYPFRSSEKRKIFSFNKCDDGTFILRAETAEFETALYDWRILSGTNQGAGNINNPYITLPASVEPAATPSEAYLAWLGDWYITTNIEHSGADDTVEQRIIKINEKETNESFTISGIGPANTSYAVDASFENGKLVVSPQTVNTWQHSTGEINERLVGLYLQGEDSYYTWDSSVILFTGTIGSDGKATLTPGKTSDGSVFNGFAFYQCQSAGAYHYGGHYVLPNTLSRTPSNSSVSSVSARQYKGNVVQSALRAQNASAQSIAK